MQSINPYTNKVVKTYDPLTEKEINAALVKAEGAFKKWQNTDFSDRSANMHRCAMVLRNERDELANLMTMEMGKPITESRAEIEKCAWVCDYYADEAEDFLRSRPVETDASNSFIRYEPLGAILAVMPWNFPFWQVFRFAAPTLMAGNVGLLKHASNVQGCGLKIEEIFLKAGFPEGVFQTLVVRADQVKTIIENETVKAVSLTGSEAAGSSVAANAGKVIKKSVLELGGNNAFIVLDDADLKKAVEVGTKARLQNAGQSCIAAKRFIIHEKIAEDFIQRLTESFHEIKTGDPMAKTTQLGPLATIDQAKGVEKQVNDSVKKGARIIMGGKRKDAFYEPTILGNVAPGMPAFDEEVFGPVASVMIAKDTDEAIELSNKSKFGLGVSIFTRDLKKAEHLIPRIEDGCVFINELVKSDPRLPFGGTKHSGFGRELSAHGILEFVNIKTVYIANP